MCPSCSQTLESLQRKIQQLNQYLGNSCALAQTIVDTSLSAIRTKTNNQLSLKAQEKGLGDAFSTFISDTTSQKKELLKDPKLKSNLYGNIVYKALQSAYGSQFSKAYYEQIMSLTGTIVASPGKDKNQDERKLYQGSLISVQGMLKGGNYSRYRCHGKDCEQLEVVNSNNEKTSMKLRKLFLGDSTTPGVIYSYAHNTNPLTPEQKHQLALISKGTNAQVRRLAILNEQAARDYVIYALESISIQFISYEIDYAFKLVQNALSKIPDDPQLDALQQLLHQNHTKYLTSIATEQAKYDPSLSLNYFNQLINAFDPVKGGLRAK